MHIGIIHLTDLHIASDTTENISNCDKCPVHDISALRMRRILRLGPKQHTWSERIRSVLRYIKDTSLLFI